VNFSRTEEFDVEDLLLAELQQPRLVRRGMACVAPGGVFWSLRKKSCRIALTLVTALALVLEAKAQTSLREFALSPQSLPSPRTKAIGLNANGTLLVLGGLPLKGNKSLVDELASDGSWSEVEQLPDNKEGLGVGIDALGRVIVFGGIVPFTTTPVTAGFVYTAKNGPGEAIASKHFAVYNFAFATDGWGRVYSIGGALTSGFPLALSGGVERYDASTDTWTTLAPMPSPRTKATAVFDGLGHILVFGGIDANSTVTTTVFSYDVEIDAWTQLADVPLALTGPINDGAAVLGADGLIYLVGPGSSVFDPVLKVWFPGPALQVIRGAPATALGSDGFIYVMGGVNTSVHGDFLDTVERLDTASPALPSIFSTPPKTLHLGAKLSYQIIASGHPRPSYSVVNGPPAMSVEASTGLVTWTPAADEAGSHSVTVRASSSAGAIDQSFTISVIVDQPVLSRVLLPQAEGLRLSGGGTPGFTYGIEASPDLAIWSRIGNCLADGTGQFQFTDATTGNSTRFYRVVFP